MSYTITEDSIQSNTFGYAYNQPDEVIVATGVLVSSTERAGVFSAHASSRLINNGHIVSASMDEGNGNGVEFDENGCSVLNASNASITGLDAGIRVDSNKFALGNYGEIRGLRGDDDSFGVLVDSTRTSTAARSASSTGQAG